MKSFIEPLMIQEEIRVNLRMKRYDLENFFGGFLPILTGNLELKWWENYSVSIEFYLKYEIYLLCLN